MLPPKTATFIMKEVSRKVNCGKYNALLLIEQVYDSLSLMAIAVGKWSDT